MIRNEATYDLIAKYLNQELSAQELDAFRLSLQQDPELREELALLREIPKQAYQEDEKTIAHLHRLGDKYFVKKEKHKRLPLTKIFAVAASLLIIVVAVFIFQSQAEFTHASIDLTELGDDNSSLAKGEAFFNDKNYEEALVIFHQYLKKFPDDIAVMEATGLCYLYMDKHDRATATFEQIINSDAIYKYKDNARWYLALNAFRADDKHLSKKILAPILKDENSRNREKAKELMLKM